MKNLKLVIIYLMMMISSSSIFAGLSPTDQEVFSQVGFVVKSYDQITPMDPLALRLKSVIQQFCDNNPMLSAMKQEIYFVTDYRKAPGKDDSNYGPQKTQAFNTLLLTSYTDDNPFELKGVLEHWINNGLSSHVILPPAGGIVFWLDPFASKCQMAGPENNNKSFGALVGVGRDKNVFRNQYTNLHCLTEFYNAYDNTLRFCRSYSEVRPCGTEGVIHNISAVRKGLKLN